ncbi:MAG: glycoside hydrolase family 3 C-terminal domain-containing protein [Clostridiales bacterium]|nr:glycoside hydrolase family 3 C-terminal domain-containing protein [Clostridiales bacterium]
MKKITRRDFLRGSAAGAAGFALSGVLNVSLLSSRAEAAIESSTNYVSDYEALEKATEAASELSNLIADEGMILLKNDNTLPLNGDEWVTLFSSADELMAEGMREAGFHVYEAGTDVSSFSESDATAYMAYGDVAIVQISGGNGGEGSTDGYLTSEVEDNMDADGNVYTYADGTEFVHAAQAYDGANYYKHPLEIKDATEQLISFATAHYNKVVVILTGSSPIEAGILRDNEKINGIIWTGVLGETGWQGTGYSGWGEVGYVLNGEVNPSGRTVDIWAYDFTANPTWANDGNSGVSYTSAADEEAYAYDNVSVTQAWRTEDGEYAVRAGHTDSDTVNNYYVVQYEEDIYVGYRYYETMAADYDDYVYENAVAFAFGYGLSYTEFDWDLMSVDDSDWGKEQSEWTNGGKITLTVKVTNTGSYAGKDVIEVYGHAPYVEGRSEKAEVVLVGFEKTSTLRPNQSETISIDVNIQDLASFDSTEYKTYVLDAADGYELRIQTDSHTVKTKDDVELKVALAELTEDILLSVDDFSGKEIKTLFSNGDIYNTLGYDPESGSNLVEEGKMTLMSRSSEKGGLKGTFPTLSTADQMVRSDSWYAMVDAFADYEADSDYGEGSYYSLAYGETAVSEDETSLPWVKAEEDIPSGWSQQADADTQTAAKESAGDSWVRFSDLKGAAYEDEMWMTLMNELTYDDMVDLVSRGAYQTVALEAIDKKAGRYMDSASVVDQELTSRGFNWGDCPHAAATWNKELMYRRGVISGSIGLLSDASSMMSEGVGLTGWYAPAVDLHRSPFGGRTSEYFSEDGYLSGHIAGNIVNGMASRGIICTLKHIALNENETQRQSLFTYVSEQAAREIYFKAFQIVLQEYDCGAIMTSYNNIGEVHSDANYNFLQGLVRDEWGFQGFQTTDAVTPMSNFFSMDTMLRAGGNLLLSNVSEETGAMKDGVGNCAVSGIYDADQNVVLLDDGSVSPTQWYWLRNAAQQILFVEANSKQSENGVDLSEFSDQSGSLAVATQAAAYEVSIALDLGDVSVDYVIISGELPDGMSLTDGVISGTPTTAGTYEVTIEAEAFNWITAEATFSIEVESAISLTDATDSLTVGTSYLAAIDMANAGDYTSLTYAIADDSVLPAGLELSEDGIISGTPTVAGTYEVGICVIGSVVETNMMNQETVTSTTFTTYFTFTVA